MAFSTSSLACFAMVAVAVAAMAATTVVEAQNTPQEFVRLHNDARAMASVGPVSWDDMLARYAHDYAAKLAGDCGSIDPSRHGCGPYGENVFWGAPGGGPWPRTWRAADAVASWVGEKQWYRPRANVCSAPWGQTCEHYTQVVWARSTRIGCAVVSCAGGRGGGGRGGVLIVCTYDPQGNVHGQRP